QQDRAVSLQTSIRDLSAARPAAAAKLPLREKQWEPKAWAVVSHLPRVLQEAYLLTLHDYPTLTPDDQKKFIQLVDDVGGVSKSDQAAAGAILRAQFPATASQDKIAEARRHPHETCFLISDAVAKAKAQHGRRR